MKHIKIFILAFLLFLPHVIYAATTWNTATDGLSATLQPSPYENDSDVTTTLSIQGALRLQVAITGELEYEGTCSYDYVTLSPNTGTPTSNTKYCGTINDTFIIDSDHIDLVFHSDYSVVKSGVSVTITKINIPPTANAGADQTINLGESVTLNGSGTDSDGTIASYQWTEGATVLSNSASFSKSNFTEGTHILTLTVTDDDGATATDTVTITVLGNHAPVVEDMNFSLAQNSSVTFALTATDPDGDTIVSYKIQTEPSHGTLSGPENNMTYTPDTDYNGTDFFTYSAYDGTDNSNVATVHFTIEPPTIARDDYFETTYNTLLNGNVLTNDSGLNKQLTDFNDTGLDGNLSPVSSDGSFSFMPSNRFDGNTSFTYTIKDDFNNTSTATVYITVHPPRNDMSIVKTAPEQSDASSLIEYTLTIESIDAPEYISAKNVRVTDNLPAGMIFDSFIYPSGWTCVYSSGRVTCDASDISPGYTGVITIKAYTPNSLSPITNTAKIGSDTIDPDPSNNTSSATTTINASDIDLSITKTVSVPTVNATSAFSYTINVQNNGSVDATAISVTDILDSSLGFIAVTEGAGWSCSQSSSINCSYSGTLSAGASSSNIVIEVRAPSTTGTITNTASVSSNGLDANPADNNDSVDVTITSGTNSGGDVPFTKYSQYNLHGDMKLIGNVNIWKPGSAEPGSSSNNNDYDMTFSDTDSDGSTFNSSWANLDLGNPNYEIVWAGLYWLGQICPDSYAQCDNSNAGGNYNALDSAKHTIKLKTPGDNTYRDITAHTVNSFRDPTNNQLLYQGFRDITEYAQSQGRYTVANLRTSEGTIYRWGGFGGWAIEVVYRDPSNGMHYKNVSLFNGFRVVNGGTVDIEVDGFTTPRSGTINASLGFFVGDGDAGSILGDILTMQNANANDAMQEVTDTLNYTGITKPAGGGIFNGSITELGSYFDDRSNPHTNNLGIDIDRLDVHDFMTNSQTSTRFRFTSGNDIHTISHIAFATDLTTPIIDDFSKSAEIIYKDGTRHIAAPDVPIYPGSLLEYTIKFTNTGDEEAEEVEIFDDFDFDGLTPALDLRYFDYSKLKLFKENTEINNPDCGYDTLDRRVYCKIDTVGINESYTMLFTVTVKEQLDDSVRDNNASNTAYAKYRNPNGNSYIERYTTPITNEPVGGKSKSLNAGTFKPNTGNHIKYISIDAINANYDYAQDRNITTKIVNQPFNIQLIHRDINKDPSSYVAWKNTVPMAVIVTLESKDIMAPINDPATSMFNHGVAALTIPLTLTRAHRSDKLLMKYLDWHYLIGKTPSTSGCRQNYELSTNLNGVPACFNDTQYLYVKDIFPANAYPRVAACFGTDTSPCNPLNYGTNGEPRGSILPEVYNHNFGCYQCIVDGTVEFKQSSTDTFSARPDYFNLSSDNRSFPDLLRSGTNYSLSLVAQDGATTPSATLDYNTSTARLSMGDPVLDPQGLKNVPLEGNTTLNKQVLNSAGVPVDSNISDGTLRDENGDPAERLGLSFDNVGDISAYVRDIDWASTDADDTPLVDCNDTSTPVNDRNEPIEAYRNICGELNATFIPHHFKVEPKLVNHNDVGKFTYIANDLNMSAHVELKITAENEQNQTTTNFKKDAYQNDIAVNLQVTDWNTSFAIPTIRQDSNGNRLDANIKIKDIPTALAIDFGTNGEDNGTHTIDTNTSTPWAERILFNYARTNNNPKNPFDINGSEANLTVTSRYTSTSNPVADEGTAEINGTDVASSSARFYYGRVHPLHNAYTQSDANNSVITPIELHVYCHANGSLITFAQCAILGIDTTEETDTSDEGWWGAVKHDMANNDGNVSFVVSPAGDNGIIAPARLVMPLGNAQQDVIVTLGLPNEINPTRPATVLINLDTSAASTTSEWLIFNNADPDADPIPFETVNYDSIVAPGGGNSPNWTGHGATGFVVDGNTSRTINKRLGW